MFPLPIGMYPFRDKVNADLDSEIKMFPLPIGMYPFRDNKNIRRLRVRESKFPLPIGMYPFRDRSLLV